MGSDDAFSAELPDSRSRPIPPLDDHTLERLLGGRLCPEDAPPAYAEVARLLRAAAGPARPDELAGQAAALATFRAEGRRPVRGRHRPTGPRWPIRLVAIGVAGVLAAAGAAVAIPDGPLDPVEPVARPAAARSAGASPDGDPLLLQRQRSAPAAPTAVPSERAPVRHGGRGASGHDRATINDRPKHKQAKPRTAKQPKPKKPKRR
jgi:hypothetical protein